jgi:hypothetical protein
MLYENAMQQPTMTVDRYGNKIWRLNGKWHREDGPAYEFPNGGKVWYLHGELHREDGPAAERADGTKEWYLHGKCHREDGPAFEGANGNKAWYLHDKLHREDGPAVERADGYKAWYVSGIKYKDIFAWAKALLKMKGINDPSEDEINDKVQQVTSASILD